MVSKSRKNLGLSEKIRIYLQRLRNDLKADLNHHEGVKVLGGITIWLSLTNSLFLGLLNR